MMSRGSDSEPARLGRTSSRSSRWRRRTSRSRPDDLRGLATLDQKAAEAGFIEAADRLKLRAIAVGPEVLRGMADGVRTHSPRVQALHGVGSVAEAAALAAAGPGARLLLSRIASERVTCALAQGALS